MLGKYTCTWFSDVNKTTSLKTKTKTKTTESKTKTKTKTKTEEAKTKTKVAKTYTKTNVIAADNVIINGKVAIIVSFLQHNILYVFTVFYHNFLCVVYI